MSTLIRQATIIAMDEAHGSTPFTGDILIEGDRIKAIGADLGPLAADREIDGRDRLVMPGLVNGHLHSGEALFKGRYDNMPLELWMLYCYPILGATPPGDRLIYLRTMVVAMESLAQRRDHRRRRCLRAGRPVDRSAGPGFPGL